MITATTAQIRAQITIVIIIPSRLIIHQRALLAQLTSQRAQSVLAVKSGQIGERVLMMSVRVTRIV